MDLSKLPKLSNTQGQEPAPGETPAETTPPTPAVAYRSPGAYNSPGIGADVWVNVVIGLLLIGVGFTFARFLIAKITGQPFHTNVNWTSGANEGQEVAYFDLEGFTAWTQMGIFLFGLVMLFEAAARCALQLKPGGASRGVLMMTLALTLATTALNLVICIKLFSAGITPLTSGLALAFGGWIIADEWRMLKTTAPRT